MYGLKERDVIRVKVKYCDDINEPLIKKFAIDPRLTNFDVLLGLLIKGLNLRREFIIHYLAIDDFGDQFYLPLLSDWDLDAAILTASDPLLRLKVNIKHQEKELDEWDIVVPGEAPVKLNKSNLNIKVDNIYKQIRPSITLSNGNTKPIHGSFLNQMMQQVEKTMTSVQRVFSSSKGLDGAPVKVMKSPMSDVEFKNYMDNIGRIIQPDEFKQSVYLGGLEPSLRKVGWRLLLNVYPSGLTGRERLNLLDSKSKQYRSLKHVWKQKFKTGTLTEAEMAQIALVSVDVVRTDRSLQFYSGEKNQQHVAQLFDILATYCIYHPSIGYYQGMSDLASPLLFVQCDEAVAYLCFCSLMRRVHCNFTTCSLSSNTDGNDQSSIVNKLKHLYDVLLYLDRELALFLLDNHLGNLFFAHRWILLEMKREFCFMDSLRLLEIQWASLPKSRFLSEPSKDGVSLIEDGVGDSIVSGPLCPQHHHTKRPTRVRCYAVRDMTIICSLVGAQYAPAPNSPYFSRPNKFMNFFEENFDLNESDSSLTSNQYKYVDSCLCESSDPSKSTNGDSEGHKVRKKARNRNSSNFSDDDEEERSKVNKGISASESVIELPPPEELGLGNPFLIFLCVSLMLEYREVILRGVCEASDILVLFQRANQRHNVTQILNRARTLFDQYCRDQEIKRRNLADFPEIELSF